MSDKHREMTKSLRELANHDSPENREAFKDRYRDYANDVIDDTIRRTHSTYRECVKQADIPELDIESDEGYNDFLNGD